MLLGCYVAGAIPLAFTMSEKRLRMISTLGAGLLIGKALATIIPEDHGSLIHKSPDAGEKSHAQSDSSEEHLNIGILKHHVSKV
ncbi:PREDICTED: zinc transporter ZIP9-like [Acropora digitifera]|uniref:zinc transporter ZIP9-like n=1 Tax=Acropora digitifera TaxID=70779 RepID=UPI00077A4761|nr:PREDICTED: zinc transporter ZIP9-like [Acropora digitifera]